jgi:hypothetical protein
MITRKKFNNRANSYIYMIYRYIEIRSNFNGIVFVAFCYNALIQNTTFITLTDI